MTQREKRYFFWLSIAILFTALLEVAGVASILPFMQLIAAPEVIETNPLLRQVYTLFGFEDHRSMLISSGIFVILLLAFANIFSIFALWMQHKYIWFVAHRMCMRLLKTYVNKPYQYFLNKNTSELRSYLVYEVNLLTSSVLSPLIELISRLIVAIIIFGFLLFVNFKIALVAFVLLGGAYVGIYLVRQRLIKTLGEQRLQTNVDRYKFLEELLTGIKTVKAYQTQAYFVNRYERTSAFFSTIAPKFSVITASPKYVLEILAFGGILAITLYIFIANNSITAALPILSLYAAAGYKLLPALQKAFGAITKIKHNLPILDKLYDDLIVSLQTPAIENHKRQVLQFKQSLTLDGLAFRYEGMPENLFEHFSVSIQKGERIAFVGSTGSGKTTIVDLIVGLLTPQQGSIQVDGVRLDKNNRVFWQNQIAYVPQDVFLFDDTIAQNVVFGYEGGAIDVARLKAALKMTDIADFVYGELPEGITTKIGERGVRLSGGQRQRIGLARALYREPSILILDEATSALDNITEKSIIDALASLPKGLTVIIIAHRLSTVKYADRIYMLEKGQIVSTGNYEQLMKTSDSFREMALIN